jgi:hypothetical protein
MVNHSCLQSHRFGMALLVEGQHCHSDFNQKVFLNTFGLNCQAFGIKIPQSYPVQAHRENWKFFCIDADSVHDEVERMLAHIRIMIQGDYGGHNVMHLRVILAQNVKERPECHSIYYEMWSSRGVHISNGQCTDYNEIGCSGKKRLDAVFEFLAAMYGLTVEYTEIALAETRRGQQLMHEVRNRRYDI